MRFLVYDRYNGKYHWSFGIVTTCYMAHFFYVETLSKWKGVDSTRFRKDGMDKPGKGAKQIIFRLTPEEQEDPVIQTFISITRNIKHHEETLSSLACEIDNGETVLFPEIPLPEA